ncbi:MAG: QueT transporter family protein [Oscillospiraceae bacterium]|nr:QueT transporter family protein [Oscillospiraceae bacterium]
MKNTSVRKLCACAIIAALYAAITILTAPFSYGLVQFRLSEALVVLCALAPSLGIGITLGCFLANLFSTVTALDMVVGTLATALACLWTAKCKKPWTVIVPNILTNTVIVGGMLAVVLMPDKLPVGFLFCGGQVALGEIAVMALLGMPLYVFAKRTGFVQRVLGE